jgi:NADH-quinone oxidoreductase subunit C
MNRVSAQTDFSGVFREAFSFEPEYDPAAQVLRLEAEHLPQAFKLFTEDSRLKLNYLRDMTAKEGPEGQLFTVYNFVSLELKHVLMVIARVSEDLVVPTATSHWDSADWMEREAYDMFGIRFAGHPDLRRIYLEETVDFYPLRKSFKLDEVPNVGDLGGRERELAKVKAKEEKA